VIVKIPVVGYTVCSQSADITDMTPEYPNIGTPFNFFSVAILCSSLVVCVKCN